MLIRVDSASGQPLHEQLAGQIRGLIAAGDPAPGERLPSARQLAESLDVNIHTLLRAYQTLADEGLVAIRRGRGTVVTGVAPRLAVLTDLAQELVEQARRSGLDNKQIIRMVEVQL